jgi:hypothetical protein
VWTILQDGEHIRKEEDPMIYPDELEVNSNIDFDDDQNLSEILFREFMPSIEGHAILMDEYLSDTRAAYYATTQQRSIKFHQPDNPDPDWIVKNCYLLLLAAATEADVGVENLWKAGDSGCLHPYANFGKFVPLEYFKAFQSCAHFMFCNREHWFKDKRDCGWEIFQPCLDNFNLKRRSLFVVTLLILDESMSGWRPKTSAYGGLPNITFEPRKPVNLGTQLKNGVECLSGIFAFQDVVMAPEVQRRKKFYYSDVDNLIMESTSLPKSPDMQAHTAEVLRQVEGAGVKEGGWCGGDAWFGSVMTTIELKIRLGVHSTFIITNNKQFFPMAPLYSILKARHGQRITGHWVVMRTTIAGVDLIAIAYAWSQKGISYFISTCGSTEPSIHKYESKYDNEWGELGVREIDRPNVVHFLYEYLPLIDEHNKQRQSILELEKLWLTKDPWFRLLCTLMGMTIVDFHRFFRYNSIKIRGKKQEEVDTFRVVKFIDKIARHGLRLWTYKEQCSPSVDSLEWI